LDQAIRKILSLKGCPGSGDLKNGISNLRRYFFCSNHERRTEKHFADITGGAAGKRLNMFLRIIKVAINQNKLIHLALIQ